MKTKLGRRRPATGNSEIGNELKKTRREGADFVPDVRTFMDDVLATADTPQKAATCADRWRIDYYYRLLDNGMQRETLWLGAGNDEIVHDKIYPILCPPLYAEAVMAFSHKRGFTTASTAIFQGRAPHHNTLGDSILRIDGRDHLLGNARYYGTIDELGDEPIVIFCSLWFNEDPAHISILHKKTHSGYQAAAIVMDEINQQITTILAADPTRVISSSGRLRTYGDGKAIAWNDLILDESKKKLMKDAIASIDRKASYRRFGLPLRRTLLFSGSPGTGKSTAIAAILSALPESLKLYLNPEDINRYDSAKRMRDFLVIIEQAGTPAIIIWEDFQAGLTHGWEGADTTEAMAFFSELDGVFAKKSIPLLFLLTTNHPDVIPEAALRKGRIDHEIKFDLPNADERMLLLQLFAGENTILEEDAHAAARSLNGLSGADLKEIVFRAKMAALERDGDVETIRIGALDLMRAAEDFTGIKRKLIGFVR